MIPLALRSLAVAVAGLMMPAGLVVTSTYAEVEVKSDKAVEGSSVRGKIAKIEGKVIVVKEDVDERHRVRVTDMTRFTLNGRPVKFEDLKFGQAVWVTGEKQDNVIVAKKVAVTTVN